MSENDIEKQVDRMLHGISHEEIIDRIHEELEKLSIEKLCKVEKYILFMNMTGEMFEEEGF